MRLVITGAASGIGAAVLARAVAGGAQIAALDLTPDAGAPHPEVIPLRCDVSDAGQVCDAMERAVSAWGAPPTALIACAGIYPQGPSLDITSAAWDTALAVNLRGSMLVAQAVARSAIDAGSAASVVLLSSVAAARGDETEPAAAYAASKGAIVSLVRQLAVEWGARGIRVNTVLPGVIDTPMTTITNTPGEAALIERLPLRRIGTADEVAQACLFLAGPAASYITGAALPVDGGYLVS